MAKANRRIVKNKKPAKRFSWFKPLVVFLRWSVLVSLGFAVVGTAGFYSLKLGQEFLNRPIAEIKINSEFNYVAQDTVSLLLEKMVGDSFVGENIDRIKSQLEAMPWIDQVNLARQWPDRLVVDVKEQTPIARWGDDSFINVRGELIHIVDNDSLSHLAKLSGRKIQAKAIMQQYSLLAARFQRYGVSVSLLEQDRRGAWQLELSNGWQLVLGRGDVFVKIQRLTHLLDQQLLEITADIKVVDIRYPNGLAIEWLDKDQHDENIQLSAEQTLQGVGHKRG